MPLPFPCLRCCCLFRSKGSGFGAYYIFINSISTQFDEGWLPPPEFLLNLLDCCWPCCWFCCFVAVGFFKGPRNGLAKGGRHYHFQARPRRSYYDSPNGLNFRVQMGSGALPLVWPRSVVRGQIGYTKKGPARKQPQYKPFKYIMLHCCSRNPTPSNVFRSPL